MGEKVFYGQRNIKRTSVNERPWTKEHEKICHDQQVLEKVFCKLNTFRSSPVNKRHSNDLLRMEDL